MAKEVRDPIHGLITLRDREWAVIDTEPFQRLRGVQQLAMTHLVYPGARHSRYEHCMGASNVAGRMTKTLDIADDDRVRLAALVHDIGHGPFSHVSEFVFEQLTKRKNIHEHISAAILLHHPEVNAAIGGDDANWIADLLRHTGHAKARTVERDIVSGPADIDKLDYLLRDSHYCGVEYGKYDIQKLIESARVATMFGEQSALGFSEQGIFAVESMLLARYHMHRQVYGHKTRIATDLMLIRAMVLGVHEGVLPVEVFSPPEELGAAFVSDYLKWDDHRVTRELCDADGTKAQEIMLALRRRKLIKRVIRFSADELRVQFGVHGAGYILKPSDDVLDEAKADAEAQIAATSGVEPHWAYLYWEDRDNPISKRSSFRVSDKDILIVDENNKSTPFHEASEVFTDEERAGRLAICLYLKPPGDVPLDEQALANVKAAAFEAFKQIGERSAAV